MPDPDGRGQPESPETSGSEPYEGVFGVGQVEVGCGEVAKRVELNGNGDLGHGERP